MSNPELITLDLKSPPQRIRVTVPHYDDMAPFMGAAMQLYAASMRDTGLERLPGRFAKLLTGYYNVVRIDKKVVQTTDVPAFTQWIGDRVMICLTGGKDSVMQLIECIDEYGKDRLIGFYVDGLNRSEQSYEREAVVALCKLHGIPHIIAKAQISGQMNRMGHMIGMRDQLILTMATMYARREAASTLAMGLHFAESSETSPLWSESRTAITLWADIAKAKGFPVTIRVLPYDELETIDRIIGHMDSLNLSVSCYTQRNFRENQHQRMVKKLPGSWVHPNGCGLCIKCVRIQAVIAENNNDQQMIDYVIDRFCKDFPGDGVLGAWNERIQSRNP